jgi:hypothetical protein
MAEEDTDRGRFDITPDPRVLQVLGDYDFKPWQCLAEFIDNSVDGFLHAKRSDNAIENPEVKISLPTQRNEGSRVTIKDNGPGMSPETLERSCKAGWSGNNTRDNLGLFGVGFNISTARLSLLTTILTTQRGSTEWHGMRIDLRKLQDEGHFMTPHFSRPASAEEHGTEIILERLKTDQLAWLTNPQNRSNMKKKLETIYTTMLRANGDPIHFKLMINDNVARPKDHCIWGGPENTEREVQASRQGVINAFQNINWTGDIKKYCERCRRWLNANAEKCIECDTDEHISTRTQKIKGWLGIQRYLDKNEFGIDILRNGRKILTKYKGLFDYEYTNEDDETITETEYPTDDPRGRGRIVGEIHLDHGDVPYDKSCFTDTHQSWKSMVSLVRGAGPLRPNVAAARQFSGNTSPLYMLFQAFRRSTTTRQLPVHGELPRLLLVKDNGKAKEYYKKFQAGDPEYQTDTKWWELIKEADDELVEGGGTDDGGTDDGGTDDGGTDDGGTDEGGTDDGGTEDGGWDEDDDDDTSEYQRTRIDSLSQRYQSHLFDEQIWEVEVFEVDPRDQILTDDKPWHLEAGDLPRYSFYYNPNHSIFSAFITPADTLILELANTITIWQGRNQNVEYSLVLSDLMDRYAVNRLDASQIHPKAQGLLNRIAIGFSNETDVEKNNALWEELSEDDKDDILRVIARRSLSANIEIQRGKFMVHAPREKLIKFLEQHPELYFDGNFWDAVYTELGTDRHSDAHRAMTLSYYVGLINDVVWLEERGVIGIENSERDRYKRALLSISILEPTSRAENS